MKLSQWHDGNVKPVNIGVYESDDRKGLGFYNCWYRRWDGNMWFTGSSSLNQANNNCTPSPFQDWPWRGIVKDKK